MGLVTAARLADAGHRVTCIDSNKTKVALLNKGKIPIYEPGLGKLVTKNKKTGRLFFSTSLAYALKEPNRAEIVFIAVGTPPQKDGGADLSFIDKVSVQIAKNIRCYTVIVEKSTVPVGTGLRIKKIISKYNKKNIPFDVVSNPEFLREGSALRDFSKPYRIIIGTSGKKAKKLMKTLYARVKAPVLFTDIESAEIIKYASNCFLAAKISFINAVANICEHTGANIKDVSKGMGLDKRIAKDFLNAGIGFGGSCLPKDLRAFYHISKQKGYDFVLLKEVERINQKQKLWVIDKCKKAVGNLTDKTIAVLGLSFKPNTDDIRFAPGIDIIKALSKKRAKVKVYDPVAMENAKKVLKKVKFCSDAYTCVKNADCVVIATEWNEFKKLDFPRIFSLMACPVIIDGRNMFSPDAMRKKGFTYISVGRV